LFAHRTSSGNRLQTVMLRDPVWLLEVHLHLHPENEFACANSFSGLSQFARADYSARARQKLAGLLQKGG
jgi:hypothetical protein